jgi:YVTN family beta-propeller protein
MAITHDGRTVCGPSSLSIIDTATDRVARTVEVGKVPNGIALQGPGEVLLSDPATNKPVRSIAVGKQPHWLARSDDGKTAYVTNEGSNDVSVVDIASAKSTSIAVGQAPRKIVVQQASAPRRSPAPRSPLRASHLDRRRSPSRRATLSPAATMTAPPYGHVQEWLSGRQIVGTRSDLHPGFRPARDL